MGWRQTAISKVVNIKRRSLLLLLNREEQKVLLPWQKENEEKENCLESGGGGGGSQSESLAAPQTSTTALFKVQVGWRQSPPKYPPVYYSFGYNQTNECERRRVTHDKTPFFSSIEN